MLLYPNNFTARLKNVLNWTNGHYAEHEAHVCTVLWLFSFSVILYYAFDQIKPDRRNVQ